MAGARVDECCPECGHMLTNDKTMCPFCQWTTLDMQANKLMSALPNKDGLVVDDMIYLF